MVTLPLRQVLAMVVATIACTSLYSRMGDWELLGARRFFRLKQAYEISVVGLTIITCWIAEVVVSNPGNAIAFTRSALIWAGPAIVSGRLFGWRLAWIFPLLALFPLTYYGHDAEGNVRWWNWTGRPMDDWMCWVIAASSLAIGFLAILAPDRRLRPLAGGFGSS
ncbi:hypothetical protein [Planomonospora parontospora]|uniref:hypothetical protein n=1 Tax=Planomonospora parontospora TaxID=58119 RepID=UPI001670DBE3|nr:hypothetical protein [Planomonospora parontospora]